MKVCTRHWTFMKYLFIKRVIIKGEWKINDFSDLFLVISEVSRYVNCQINVRRQKKLIMIKNWWKRSKNGLEQKQEWNGSSVCCISLEDLNATRGYPFASILHSSLIIKKLSLNFLTRVSRYKSTNLLPSKWEKKRLLSDWEVPLDIWVP